MSTVRAELHAVESLRAYLLRSLPGKVDALNASRWASLQAPRSEPYQAPAGAALHVGTSPDALTEVPLDEGFLSAEDVALRVAAVGVPGVGAAVDALGRLVLIADAAPAEGMPSAVCLGPSEANRLFGWGAGGARRVRCALVAPGEEGVRDGEPELVDFGQGAFAVVVGQRSSQPRSPNARDDMHLVSLRLEVLAAEPTGSVDAAQEYLAQAVRAVREVLLEDRTLDGAVYLTQLESVQSEGRTFRFQAQGGVSPLFSAAQVAVRVSVFERS